MMSVPRYLWASPNTLLGLACVPFVLLTRGNVRVVEGVLEMCGPLVAWLLRHCIPLSGGASAITLGHVVLARDQHSLAITRGHERVHVQQYERWGPAFIPVYLIAAMWGLVTGAGAYYGNVFEREAWRVEHALQWTANHENNGNPAAR